MTANNQNICILKITEEDRSEIVKHQTAVESSAEPLHHETISEFSYHKCLKMHAS
jgi:hypothetical protein